MHIPAFYVSFNIMTVLSLAYGIIILPIESVIEFVFCFVLDKFDRFGVAGAIVAVSLAVNFLALPIYNVADEIQLRERGLQNKMSRWVTHIRKTFRGDERFMMLSEYYRQNGYRPLYALRQSLSIIIEIPFFMAAYHFLSRCPLLGGQSVLFLKDLSMPDALIPLTGGGYSNGGISLNALPVLMTLINMVSSVIYTKGAPLREKIQIHALALIFLVILYNSPSGLVCYWILNNLFSLCKNVVKKTPHPGRIVRGFLSAVFVLASVYLLFESHRFSLIKCVFYFGTILFIAIPFIRKHFHHMSVRFRLRENEISGRQNLALLLLSCLALWLLCGLVLPSSVIATSPSEFSFLGNTDSPLSYVSSSLAYFFGLFVLWPLCIFRLFGDDGRVTALMPPLFFVLAMCAAANAFLFKYDYGNFDILFQLDNKDCLRVYTAFFSLAPLLFCVGIFLLFLLLKKYKKEKFVTLFTVALVLSQVFLGVSKILSIQKAYSAFTKPAAKKPQNIEPVFHLSKTERNVVVLFLDRGISSYFPYILEQRPQLQKSFEGFVFYPNCISFGGCTILGAPPMLGGYEYTADARLKDGVKKLQDAHNEALTLMPKIFSDANFDVTVADLPYVNYDEFDRSVFEAIRNVSAIEIQTAFGEKYIADHKDELSVAAADSVIRKRITRFNLMQSIYPPLRIMFYCDDSYFTADNYTSSMDFINCYAELYYLPRLTDFSSGKATLTVFVNLLCHNSALLTAPDYTPENAEAGKDFAGIGSYPVSDQDIVRSYCSNAAALILVGRWLDFLKENGVYDNTRIIIVSDHGYDHELAEFQQFSDPREFAYFNPLLLFKDFDETGDVKTDRKFMTNAETVNLARKDLDISDRNPWTGEKFKTADEFGGFTVFNILGNSGKKNPGYWKDKVNFNDKNVFAYAVRDNIFDESNWTRLGAAEAAE